MPNLAEGRPPGQIVVNSLRHGVKQLQLYTLAAYVVMSNTFTYFMAQTELSIITRLSKDYGA